MDDLYPAHFNPANNPRNDYNALLQCAEGRDGFSWWGTASISRRAFDFRTLETFVGCEMIVNSATSQSFSTSELNVDNQLISISCIVIMRSQAGSLTAIASLTLVN
jgi:hypothetical protein